MKIFVNSKLFENKKYSFMEMKDSGGIYISESQDYIFFVENGRCCILSIIDKRILPLPEMNVWNDELFYKFNGKIKISA